MKKLLMLLFGFGMGFSMAHSAPFSSEEARRVFDESSVNLTTSAKVVGDYLFVEVNWMEDESEDCEMQEMSALFLAMQDFIEPNVTQCTNSPFSYERLCQGGRCGDYHFVDACTPCSYPHS